MLARWFLGVVQPVLVAGESVLLAVLELVGRRPHCPPGEVARAGKVWLSFTFGALRQLGVALAEVAVLLLFNRLGSPERHGRRVLASCLRDPLAVELWDADVEVATWDIVVHEKSGRPLLLRR